MTGEVGRVRPRSDSSAPAGDRPGQASRIPGPLRDAVRGIGPGEPLWPAVARPIATSLGVDVSMVRVHADSRARAVADGLGARAFTIGQDVYLGRGAHPGDTGLIAHEVAHTVQQRAGSPAVRLFTTGSTATHEAEAEAARAAVVSGGTFTVTGRAAAGVQREEAPGLLERAGLSLVRAVAPGLEPILSKGLVEWLRDELLDAARSLVDLVMTPVRQAALAIETVRAHFANLVAWTKTAGERIAKGDCGAISEAAEKIQAVVEGVAAPVVERVKQVAARVGAFFTELWESVGAPVWDTLKRIGGVVWKRITDIYEVLRNGAKGVLAAAWDFVKGKLGIDDSGPGIGDWIKGLAGRAWEWVKAKLEPYKKQLAVVAGVLLLLSPAGPVIAIGAGIAGLVYAARWIATHMSSGGSGAVGGRQELLKSIIPAVKGAVAGVGAALKKVAATLVQRLNSVLQGLGNVAAAIAGSVLRLAVTAFNWLVDVAKRLVAWAEQKVTALADMVEAALARLSRFFEPVRQVLEKIGRVLENVLEVVVMVAERAWNAIPACIRDPVVTFLTTHILKKIPIFAQLVEVPNVWSKIKTLALSLIRGIFRGGSLMDALEKVLRFALEVLKVPVELARSVWTKAKASIDLVLKDPTGFLRNVLLALKGGFVRFFKAIGRHLLAGIADWLFRQARDAGLTPPTDLSFKAVLGFVLDVLGISLQKVFAILEKRVGKPVVDRLRVVVRVLTGAWEWVAALVTEGPAGLWKHVQDQLTGLWDTVRGFVVDWLVGTFIEEAGKKLVSFLDPTGIMAVVNSFLAVWRAIESAVEYLGQLLGMLDSFFDGLKDIAAGAIEGAAERLERLLAAGLSVAIGFAAGQFPALKRLGTRIKDMIAKVRERVDRALESLVDRGLAAGKALIDSLRSGAAAVRKAITGLFGFRQEFSVPGTDERHTLSASDGAPERLMVASEVPQSVRDLGSKDGGQELIDLYEQYVKLGEEEVSTSSKRDRARVLIVKIQAALQKYFAGKGPGVSAPGIGNIAPHNQQPPRHQGNPLWELRSEHVVARRFINVVLDHFGYSEVKKARIEYSSLTTIMTYVGAATKIKDGMEGRLSAVVASVTTKHLKSPEGEDLALDGLVDFSVSIVEDSVAEENRALGGKRGEKGKPVPTVADITRAARIELGQIKAILKKRRGEP